MSLGQTILMFIGEIVRDYSFYLVLLFLGAVFAMDYYNRFLRINRNTDNIDLMARYCQLKLIRRYKNDHTYRTRQNLR